jgi:hypothetical protein
MAEVLQTSNDYTIKVRNNGEIKLDVGPSNGTGVVRVTAGLIVEGQTTTVNSQELAVQDNMITLNNGESGNGVTLNVSGIEIDRGFSAPSVRNSYAVFRFNETGDTWEIVDRDTSSRFTNSSLRVRTIKTDSFTDGGDLTLIGSGTGVIKVDGTTDYHLNVSGDDDIPNKRFLDIAINNRQPNNKIKRDDTYVIAQDVDGGAQGVAIMKLGTATINNDGIGYQPLDELVVSEGTRARDAKFRVDTVDGTGQILTVTMLDHGRFTALPASRFNVQTTTNSIGGTGATFDFDYSIAEVSLTNKGNDYDSATVNFVDNGGTQRVGTATATIDLVVSSVTYRQIDTVTVTDGGSYFDIPGVTFSAGLNSSLTESQVQVVVDNNPIATFYSNRTQLGDLEFLGNEITNNNTNSNIVLRTQGTASVEIPRALQYNITGEVIPYIAGASLMYGDLDESSSAQRTPGGTGLFFNNSKQTLAWQQWVTNNPDPNLTTGNLIQYPAKNELISKQKALAFSMLF